MDGITRKVQTQPHITVEEYAEFAGVGRNASYEAVRRGEVEVVRVGKLLRVLTVPLCRKHQIKSEIAA
jgi:excisionase family DNA binding protein